MKLPRKMKLTMRDHHMRAHGWYAANAKSWRFDAAGLREQGNLKLARVFLNFARVSAADARQELKWAAES